jgi:NADP-dependent 3-hydroxy acid dehydrogenase YdfG
MNIVLITGCSSGIGRALCEEYLAQDFLVYASARNIRSLEDLPQNDKLIKISNKTMITLAYL